MMINSVAGGTLALPFFETMFGPLALAGTFIAYPLIAGFWLLNLILAHVARGAYLRERDTIFKSSFPYAQQEAEASISVGVAEITAVFDLIPRPDNLSQLFLLAPVAAVHIRVKHFDE